MLTEEQLTQSIEKAIGDTAKGLATKDELKKHVEELRKEFAEAAKDENAKIKAMLEEEQKKVDALNAEIKRLIRTRFASIKDSDGNYIGAWGNHERAKMAGLFCLASVGGFATAKDALKSEFGVELKAAGEDAGTTGGILVPTELIPHLITQIERYGVFRRNSLEWPMGSDSSYAPKMSSLLTVYCPGAGTAPSTSDPAFTGVGLNAKKWITVTAIDSELTEDAAIAIGETVMGYLIPAAFAYKEDQVGFLGDGTSTYFGHVGITGALRGVDATIANIKGLEVGTGNAYSELTLADFTGLVGKPMDIADDGNLKWYVNRLFYYSYMMDVALDSGGANATEVYSGAPKKTFLGYPVEFTQVMPKAEANSQICAIFGNLKRGAYLGDRRRLTIDRSTDAYFTSDQIGIRGTERVAPSIHGQGDTTNAGTICGLITAAS